LPFPLHGGFAARNHHGLFGAVKGGQSPAQRTLDGIEKAITLKMLGLNAGVGTQTACPSGGKDFPALEGGGSGGEITA
jgi:hypothetical protein